MTDTKTYAGSCHCGKVKFEASLDLKSTATCNCSICSICSRSGHILTFIGDDAFKSISGEESLTDYQFGKKNIHHAFCSTCGIRPYAWGTHPATGKMMRAVNVRCLSDVDLKSLSPKEMDGRSLPL